MLLLGWNKKMVVSISVSLKLILQRCLIQSTSEEIRNGSEMPEPLYSRRWNEKQSTGCIANKKHGIYVTGIKFIVRTISSTANILQRGIRFWRVRFVCTLEVVYTATAARVAGGRRGYWPANSYRLLDHWNRCLFEVQSHKLFLKMTVFSADDEWLEKLETLSKRVPAPLNRMFGRREYFMLHLENECCLYQFYVHVTVLRNKFLCNETN